MSQVLRRPPKFPDNKLTNLGRWPESESTERIGFRVNPFLPHVALSQRNVESYRSLRVTAFLQHHLGASPSQVELPRSRRPNLPKLIDVVCARTIHV